MLENLTTEQLKAELQAREKADELAKSREDFMQALENNFAKIREALA
jgi:hypothetical protein